MLEDYGYAQHRKNAMSMSTQRLKDAIHNTYKTEYKDGSLNVWARTRVNAFKNELRDRGELPERPKAETFLADEWKQGAAHRLFFNIESFYLCDNDQCRDVFAYRYGAQISMLTSIIRGGFIDDVLDIVAKLCQHKGLSPWGKYPSGIFEKGDSHG